MQRVFNVHEGLLKSHSLFFRGMLRNNFAETNARLVRLPEDDVKTFAVFLQWLYTGKSHDGEISASNLDASQPEVEFTCKYGVVEKGFRVVVVYLVERLDSLTEDGGK